MPTQNGSHDGATAKQLPEIGPNKLMQALEDYDHLVDELASVKRSLAEHIELSTKLTAENEAIRNQLKTQDEFMTRQLDAMTDHRDRLQASLKAYMVSYRIIRQTIEAQELEALQSGIAEKQKPEDMSKQQGAVLPPKVTPY